MKTRGRDFRYEIEWQERWSDADSFRSQRRASRPKWFIVELPPFANGRIHLGHVRNYVIGDVIARFRRAAGYDVLYTTGFDSFGLPNEIAAGEERTTPAALVRRNQPVMTAQLSRLGLSHDRSRVLSDHQPSYYRWVQWVFLRLREAGLIERRPAATNWCPSCETTLADSLVEQNRCWRCRTEVQRLVKDQWFVLETKLAERLAEQDLRNWPKPVLDIHLDWIGRREGLEVDFQVEGAGATLTVFAERETDLRKVASIVLAAQGPEALALGRRETLAPGETRDSGLWAREAASDWRLPVFLQGETSMSLGGASFGWRAPDGQAAARDGFRPGDDGSASAKVRSRPAVRTRLRDWDIARSRYWGTPVPIVHCEACGEVAVPDDQLPVILPEDLGVGPGGNPLERCESFLDAACPACGVRARRETDTLEAYSSPWWYYLICSEPQDPEPFRSSGAKWWMPVDLMIGGIDQARTCFFHLRTLAVALSETGVAEDLTPVEGLLAIGMVKAEGRKMSKSTGNSVDPADLIEHYGADALRWAIISAAAPDQDFNWSNDLIVRGARFLSSVRLFIERHAMTFAGLPAELELLDERRRRLSSWLTTAREKISASLERNALHVAAQQLVFLFDQIRKIDRKVEEGLAPADPEAFAFAGRLILQLLAPFAPHLAEELWRFCDGGRLLVQSDWPTPFNLPQADASPRPASQAPN